MKRVTKVLTANHRPRALLGLFLSFLAVFPIYFMVVGSISPVETFLRRDLGEILLPRAFVGDHMAVVAFDPVFLRFALNSMIVATGTTFVSIVVATLGAYSLARLRFPGGEVIGRFALLTYTVPSVLLLIPLFKIVVTLNLANNLVALIITYTTFSVPFCLWLLRSYFQSLPRDLEEAAMVDGASRLGALFRVILPLSVPGIVATALFANSPFVEGRAVGWQSWRSHLWEDTDPDRCGILPFVRILSWLLRRHHQVTIARLIGFVAGSLRKVWPFKAAVPGQGEPLLREVNVLPEIDGTFWLALGLCVVGFLLVLCLDRIASARTRGNDRGE